MKETPPHALIGIKGAAVWKQETKKCEKGYDWVKGMREEKRADPNQISDVHAMIHLFLL